MTEEDVPGKQEVCKEEQKQEPVKLVAKTERKESENDTISINEDTLEKEENKDHYLEELRKRDN